MADLDLQVRFLRHGTDDGIECVESELGHGERRWRVPAEQSALVLVDCWAEHFITSHQENSGRIMREVLKPAVEAARAAGVTVVHAPSPTYVEAYPQWVAYASDRDLGLVPAEAQDDWPPPHFRRKEGEYAPFARLPEPKIREWGTDPSRYRIFEELGPLPGDFVVKTGEQLHRLLKHRKLLHLFYAGFAANICMLYRDYGTRAMAQRGYNVVLLRDCTVGIEARDTESGQWLTTAAIYTVEMSSGHSATAADFIRACREAGTAGAPSAEGRE
ncbi:MAG TPA: isochorismatase family protein [Armatimonadota bacterium]|nr:isochorismatase family protein [Armatimonadota bacterium]